jgi:hypothetical protein
VAGSTHEELQKREIIWLENLYEDTKPRASSAISLTGNWSDPYAISYRI